jgi:hypothetical protein
VHAFHVSELHHKFHAYFIHHDMITQIKFHKGEKSWSSIAKKIKDKQTYSTEVSVVLQWNYCGRLSQLLRSLLDIESQLAGIFDMHTRSWDMHFDSV